MIKFNPFSSVNKSDDIAEYYNRVRYIRDASKVFSDLWKSDKEFLNKSVDSEFVKSFKEFRSTDVGRAYSPSILNSTIDDLISIHEEIESKRKDWLEMFKSLTEKAREKQTNIRQTISKLRENYDRALKRFETAEANFRKFKSRSDRNTIVNYEERLQDLEDIRNECDQNQNLSRDIFITEVNRISSEENSIAKTIFLQYIKEENKFYDEVQKYLSNKIPQIEKRLDNDRFSQIFSCDLSEHCLNRIKSPIAYPIETCIHLLKDSMKEEGLFRIGPSQVKQKKFVSEIDLQRIKKDSKLYELGYDAHVVASALKQYLRELPDCLLTDVLLPSWNEIPAISIEDARLHRISQLLHRLPKVHYDNLRYLVEFLHQLSEHSAENKMNAANLGICIGFSILFPKDQMGTPSTSSSLILETMITHYKQLFSSNSQQANENQPDLIPTNHPNKKLVDLKENLIEVQAPTTHSEISPKATRKNRAPLKPPPPPPLQQMTATTATVTSVRSTTNEDSSSFDSHTSEKNHLLDEIEVNVERPNTLPMAVRPRPPSRDILSFSTELAERPSHLTKNNRNSPPRDKSPTSPTGQITQF